MTNDQIIEALKPFLDQVLAKEDNHLNEVRIAISKRDGVYITQADAWYECHRIVAPDLAQLVVEIQNFDPKERARKEKQKRIAELQVELAQLQPEALP